MATTPQRPVSKRTQTGLAKSAPSDWAWHVAIGVTVLILAMLLSVNADGSVSLVFFPGRPLPMICAVRKYFHFDCLTCGMTRSVISLVHGRLEQSLAFHRLGWVAMLVIVSQIPYGIQLRLRGEKAWRPPQLLVIGFWILAAGLLILVRFRVV